MNDWIYDLEVYPNVFTFAVEHAHTPMTLAWEISPWRDDSELIVAFLDTLARHQGRLIGFNNLGFDYPVTHMLYRMRRATARQLYDKAMAIIKGQDRFEHQVFPSDRVVPQIDLFKSWHFDNAARATSLKALEFSMRSKSIKDLPFPVGTDLTREQTEELKVYNAHDVSETKKFYHHSILMIQFRESLVAKYQDKRDWINYSDVKIGSAIFESALEKTGVQLYEYGPDGRKPRQTQRPVIDLAQCVPNYIQFQSDAFERIRRHLVSQKITETKGVFKGLSCTVQGLEYVFGTGGLHASIENEIVESDDSHVILDVDVTSMYPSIAIANRYAPEHLGEPFVAVYEQLRDERLKFGKGTTENDAYKLALNGAYGKSNDKFSIFFDPLFTMQVTLTGQMCLAMLADWICMTPEFRVLQANTDGLTVYLPRHKVDHFRSICRAWEQRTKLTLEEQEYRLMALADVNSYIAVGIDGKVKRKGRYAYDTSNPKELGWHKDHSELVVAKVAEKVLVEGAPIRETLENWPEIQDFMCRIKVPKSGHLTWTAPEQWGDQHFPEQNTTRFYVAKDGVSLWKWLPPLAKKPDEWRKFAIKSGWKVQVCNDLDDAKLPVDFDYYVEEVEKLCLRMK